MRNVYELTVYRKRRRRELWLRHGRLIEFFVRQFVAQQLVANIHDLIDEYQHLQRENEQDVWGYEEFRTRMLDAIMVRHGDNLRNKLATQSWFDPALISTEEVAEMCLTSMVLGESAPVARKYR
jgi:hypothetical protein